MRVLVTWGSKRGGTEGIGRIVAEALAARGHDVVAVPTDDVRRLEGFDAAIVGGALYANRWPANVRSFVRHHVAELTAMPVWFFSSGPLDDSADRADIPPPTEVAILAERVGAKEHVTFGGRLEPDAEGFPASAMAKEHAGDWRNPERIRAWADAISDELPHATAGTPVVHPARSIPRLLGHALAGWAATAAILFGLLSNGSVTAAYVVHAIAAPFVFVGVAQRYFGARGAREPIPTAIVFTAVVALLDLAVAAPLTGSLAIFGSFAATWLPFALIFLATWGTGALMSTMPWPAREGGRPVART